MAQPTRAEALATLTEGDTRLDELLGAVSDDELIRPATIGGGDWSAKDLIGHIASWEELALQSLGEWQRGERPWVEREGGPFFEPTAANVDAFNAQTVAQKSARSLQDVIVSADRTHMELLGSILKLTDEEWTAKASYATPEGRRRRLVNLLGSILGASKRPFGHAFAHIPDLEAYVASLR